jgi:hypothetical protein
VSVSQSQFLVHTCNGSRSTKIASSIEHRGIEGSGVGLRVGFIVGLGVGSLAGLGVGTLVGLGVEELWLDLEWDL